MAHHIGMSKPTFKPFPPGLLKLAFFYCFSLSLYAQCRTQFDLEFHMHTILQLIGSWWSKKVIGL